MTYEEYVKTEDFKTKCNTDLKGRTPFKNDWICLADNGEVSISLTTFDTLIFYDGYYKQTFEIQPNELLGLKEEIGNIIPIGFDGNISYSLTARELSVISGVVRYIGTKMINENKNRLAFGINEEELNDVIHDVLLNFVDEPTKEMIDDVSKNLPMRILHIASEWGASDTEFRERIYEFIESRI